MVGGEQIGRYSFLGVDPFLIFRSRGKSISIEDVATSEKRTFEGEPIEELRGLLGKYHAVHVEGLPRFAGGAIGYVSYDAIRLMEHIPETVDDDLNLEDVLLKQVHWLYMKVIYLDTGEIFMGKVENP